MYPCELSGNIHLSLRAGPCSDITSETSLRISGKIILAFWMCPSLVQPGPGSDCVKHDYHNVIDRLIIAAQCSHSIYRIYFLCDSAVLVELFRIN